MAAPLLAEDRKIKLSQNATNEEKKDRLRGPSHVLYNHVHVMYLLSTRLLLTEYCTQA